MASISMSHTSLAPRKHILHRQSVNSPSPNLVIQQPDTHLTMQAIAPPQTPHCLKPKTNHLAANWRHIQGANDWHNLISPLNPLLRDELIRYGEFVTACYTAFDLDPSSTSYLNCKYGQSHILHSSGLSNSGYKVTKYIYATADINVPTKPRTSWVGFVAVSTDTESRRIGRRDVLVCFRGTVTLTEWITNLMSSLTPAGLDPDHPRENVRVESGFLNLYTSEDNSCRLSHQSCRKQLLAELTRILIKYRSDEISITLAGHSMGSSLALLLGYDLAELELNRDRLGRVIPITVYSFGGPRVGNAGFKERCDELGVKVLRVVNEGDPVTKMPGVVMNEGFRCLMSYEMPWSSSCYVHVGVELSFDGSFEMGNPRCVHDLETYLGLLKCAKKFRVGKRAGLDVAGRVREWVRTQKLGVWAWMDAARHVGNLVQSVEGSES